MTQEKNPKPILKAAHSPRVEEDDGFVLVPSDPGLSFLSDTVQHVKAPRSVAISDNGNEVFPVEGKDEGGRKNPGSKAKLFLEDNHLAESTGWKLEMTPAENKAFHKKLESLGDEKKQQVMDHIAAVKMDSVTQKNTGDAPPLGKHARAALAREASIRDGVEPRRSQTNF